MLLVSHVSVKATSDGFLRLIVAKRSSSLFLMDLTLQRRREGNVGECEEPGDSHAELFGFGIILTRLMITDSPLLRRRFLFLCNVRSFRNN